MASKTYPSDPSVVWYAAAPEMHPRAVSTSTRVPTSELQALMEARPNTEPEESSLQLSEKREAANELVRTVLGIMPYDQAELIRRHYLEDESIRDIADDLDLSKSTAHRNIQAAFETMRQLIQGAS